MLAIITEAIRQALAKSGKRVEKFPNRYGFAPAAVGSTYPWPESHVGLFAANRLAKTTVGLVAEAVLPIIM